MPKKKNAGVPSLDLLYEKLLQADADSRGGSVLEICLHGNQQAIAAVPLRYRLIALGFVRSLSPEEVNRRLLDNGCAQLYARSFWEASVIYALRSGLSYGEWKNLLIQCMDLRESVMSKSAAFSSASISLSDIRRYVEDNSLRQADMAVTRHLTKELEQKLAGTDSGLQAFREFLISNIASFSTAREKTRYYFCKYLLYYLDARKTTCAARLQKTAADGCRTEDRDRILLSEMETGSGQAEDLHVFRVLSRLQRKKRTIEEMLDLIEHSALSLKTIYALFSVYYFDYPIHDWLQILAENDDGLQALSPVFRKVMADSVRRHFPDQAWKSDQDLLAWLQKMIKQLEADWETDKGTYQSGREGENYLRRILKGSLDLDRTTLIAFILYFGKTTADMIPPEGRLNQNRLNDILRECGFPLLDNSRSFDHFVCRFLETDDPKDLLFEEAEKLSLEGHNFYLYKTWRAACSAEAQWQKITNPL